MTHHETSRQLYCARCQRVTKHTVITYLDKPQPDTTVFCAEHDE